MEAKKVWKYGDNINTDIISPPAYLEYTIADAAKYTMATVDPDFGKQCQPGDIVVCEHNMGSGSSRETAPLMFRELGVRFVVAMDFARIFYRNCINVGLIPIECAETGKIDKGDMIEVDYRNGVIRNATRNETYACSKIPEHIMKIAEHGGLIGYIKHEKGL